MEEPYRIPDEEFKQRIASVQEELRKRDLDALLAFSHESEPANVRYLSDYWPAFESAGVLVPAEGDALLLIGPESETFARAHSRLPEIRKVLAFRESSEPEYPGVPLSSFEDLFAEISGGKGVRNLGLAGWNVTTLPVYEAVRLSLGDRPLVKADSMLNDLRAIKSEAEIQLLRQAYQVAEKGVQAAMEAIEPGMTEVQIASIAAHAALMNGAEALGYQLYVTSGPYTPQAIGRATHRRVRKGELIQMCVSARVEGYCSSVDRPVAIGWVPDEQRRLWEVALESNARTKELMRPSAVCRDIASGVARFLESVGYADHILYGPAHGTGLIDSEHPFVETVSDAVLEPNMVFCVDTWLGNTRFGMRIEDGARITSDGLEELSSYRREIVIL